MVGYSGIDCRPFGLAIEVHLNRYANTIVLA